jgi:long-subunit acyl-CoA synthetase (AMP-forming)
MVLIALYMKNCMEWVIAEQAIFCIAGATGESIVPNACY